MKITNQSSAGAFILRETIENKNLNGNAIKILVWMLTHSDSWEIRRDDMFKRINISKTSWATSRRQLINEGYLVQEQFQTIEGKWCNKYHVFRQPQFPKENKKGTEK